MSEAPPPPGPPPTGRPLPQSEFAVVSVQQGAVVVTFNFKSIYDPLQIENLQADLERVVFETQAAYYVLDMREVDFVSSGFVGLIVTASRTLKRSGASVRICHLTAGILRVIRTTQVDRVLDVRETLAAALADIPAVPK